MILDVLDDFCVGEAVDRFIDSPFVCLGSSSKICFGG